MTKSIDIALADLWRQLVIIGGYIDIDHDVTYTIPSISSNDTILLRVCFCLLLVFFFPCLHMETHLKISRLSKNIKDSAIKGQYHNLKPNHLNQIKDGSGKTI